jgi:hypothetical protein
LSTPTMIAASYSCRWTYQTTRTTRTISASVNIAALLGKVVATCAVGVCDDICQRQLRPPWRTRRRGLVCSDCRSLWHSPPPVAGSVAAISGSVPCFAGTLPQLSTWSVIGARCRCQSGRWSRGDRYSNPSVTLRLAECLAECVGTPLPSSRHWWRCP